MFGGLGDVGLSAVSPHLELSVRRSHIVADSLVVSARFVFVLSPRHCACVMVRLIYGAVIVIVDAVMSTMFSTSGVVLCSFVSKEHRMVGAEFPCIVRHDKALSSLVCCCIVYLFCRRRLDSKKPSKPPEINWCCTELWFGSTQAVPGGWAPVLC